jgi:proline iminopeptidase
MANKHFFPPIEPFESGILDVGEPHRLYWEQCGNPQGEPILFLHGGPGAGCTEYDRCFFNPQHFRIVLFDQRGSGRSRPVGDLSNNTMADTARDIEQLRQQLGIDRWHVFGGSYGSTISLYYAQSFPERCKSLVLRGIWLLREEELDWWLYRVRMIQPELWNEFAGFIPEAERGDLLEAYWKRLTGDDRELALEAAKHWAIRCCRTRNSPAISLMTTQPGPSPGWRRTIFATSNRSPTQCCWTALSESAKFRLSPCMAATISFAR